MWIMRRLFHLFDIGMSHVTSRDLLKSKNLISVFLHVTLVMSGIKDNKVLVDGGATINLLPERMLMKVGKHPDDLILTNISVTDYRYLIPSIVKAAF
ncbi:hypothetical protein Ahy_A08g038143 [Arachis hypogaea]|uniref:Peptidase A2 domain-containing protein n=1 Tax=Arachis hypogaea TaxID=3818 RepID=A0A445BSP6_ARAHY|nr:hypothetical protein Ahy_A08g038143 [Arachis hypogaea]